jgi:hypothetical protein
MLERLRELVAELVNNLKKKEPALVPVPVKQGQHKISRFSN